MEHRQSCAVCRLLSVRPVMTTDLRASLPADPGWIGGAMRNDGQTAHYHPDRPMSRSKSKRAACEPVSNEFVDEGTETYAP